MNYKIIFKERARKSLKLLPQKDSKRIFKIIMQLANNPYPHGYKKFWRCITKYEMLNMPVIDVIKG